MEDSDSSSFILSNLAHLAQQTPPHPSDTSVEMGFQGSPQALEPGSAQDLWSWVKIP